MQYTILGKKCKELDRILIDWLNVIGASGNFKIVIIGWIHLQDTPIASHLPIIVRTDYKRLNFSNTVRKIKPFIIGPNNYKVDKRIQCIWC